MSKWTTAKKLFKKNKRQIPYAIFCNLTHIGLTRFIPDKLYVQIMYKLATGHTLDLKNPYTFNEKLQWIKLYDRKQQYIVMVDKYLVRKYIAKLIGNEYLIPLLGVWKSADDIDFSMLPNQFVLKCNHDSGSLVICKDKSELDINATKINLNNSLKNNGYWFGREWPYKDVKPRIIAEKYMSDTDELKDYKFMCFNGKVKCSFVCSDRFSGEGLKVTFFDLDWNILPFKRRHRPKSNKPILKPKNYDIMITFAEKLSKDVPFLRVDFYEINGALYFGELTFFPGNGMEEFTPAEADLELGSWIKLP